MQIGVFDSGAGGLAIGQAVMRRLPQYDYLYLGDTKRVPYGSRSQATIHEFVSQALTFLFANDCQLVILACNTASAEALRRSQRDYLPANFPDRRVLGVVIPTAEAVAELGNQTRIGVLATSSTVESRAYPREIGRQVPGALVFQTEAPLLVPLIENDGLKYLPQIVQDYLEPLVGFGIDSLVLGCTHYCLIKDLIRSLTDVPVISQDEVIPEKLAFYLNRHPEMESRLGKNGRRRYLVTDLTSTTQRFGRLLAGNDLNLELVDLA